MTLEALVNNETPDVEIFVELKFIELKIDADRNYVNYWFCTRDNVMFILNSIGKKIF